MKKQVRSSPKAPLAGFKPKNDSSKDRALVGRKEYQEGRSKFARGGSVGYPLSPSTGGAGGGLGRRAKARSAAKIPDDLEC